MALEGHERVGADAVAAQQIKAAEIRQIDEEDAQAARAVQIRDGHVLPSLKPGLGMKWNEKAVRKFAA